MIQKIKLARIVSEKLPVPPVKGGATQTSVYYSSLLMKDTFDITIFSRPTIEQNSDILNYEPIPCSFLEKIAENILNNWKIGKIFIVRFFLKALIVYLYARKCAKRMKKKDYDLIIIHNNPNFVPIIKKNIQKGKIILSMHNLHLTRGKYLPFLKWFYKKKVVKQSDLIIANAKMTLNEIINMYPEAKAKCKLVYHGIKTDRFYKRDDDFNKNFLMKYKIPLNKVIILFAGRLVKVKGLHILLDALRFLKNRDFILIIAGSPSFGEEIKRTKFEKMIYKKAEKIKENVIFLGYINQDELSLFYSASDIYVLPTLQPFEGCPQALLEAMASECCVIGDFPELIKDGYNGYLVESGNYKKLAIILEKTISNKEKRKILGKNARKTIVEYFTIELYSERLNKTFLELLKNN